MGSESMKSYGRPGRACLLAIEMMIAVGVFAACAAICMGLSSRAYATASAAADLDGAVAAARNVAECFSAAHGDLAVMSDLTDGSDDGDRAVIYYDAGWNVIGRDRIAAYSGGDFPGGSYAPMFRIVVEKDPGTWGYSDAVLRAERLDGSGKLLSWRIAALEATA